jgi:hypothetical protein
LHKAIFSENERKIINHYLDTGKKLPGFRVLKHRILQNDQTILSDKELMINFLLKTEA